MTTVKCQICDRLAVANLDPDEGSLPVCGLHRDYLLRVVLEASTKEAANRLIGFGYAIEEPESDGYAMTRCDKCSVPTRLTIWRGRPGGWCPWCLLRFASQMEDQRKIILQDPESDIEDQRYESECRRKGEALKHAVKIGLVTTEEALARFDKWVSYV